MQLSRQADYALRMVLDLSAEPQPQGRIKDIAQRQGIPEPYLAKVVQVLARAGLVHTVRGPRGGVRLAHSPQNITLRQVVEAAEGPLALTRCLAWAGECPQVPRCSARRFWGRLQETMVAEMEAVTMADLVGELPPVRQPEPVSATAS